MQIKKTLSCLQDNAFLIVFQWPRLVSGSRRNEVPKGGWSGAELLQSLPTTTQQASKPVSQERLPYFGLAYSLTWPYRQHTS